MKVKSKIYVEEQKKNALARLNARRASLKEKGLNDAAIGKDAMVRKLKADVRKADYRLTSIASLVKRNETRAKATADKLAAGKVPKEKGKKAAKKEEAPAKKEKKAKKAKAEKPAASEESKE
jgi:hypothetical protein